MNENIKINQNIDNNIILESNDISNFVSKFRELLDKAIVADNKNFNSLSTDKISNKLKIRQTADEIADFTTKRVSFSMSKDALDNMYLLQNESITLLKYMCVNTSDDNANHAIFSDVAAFVVEIKSLLH